MLSSIVGGVSLLGPVMAEISIVKPDSSIYLTKASSLSTKGLSTDMLSAFHVVFSI